MLTRFRRCTLQVLCLTLSLPAGVIPAAENEPATKMSSIRGVVTYQADPRRSWRYARYYVKDRRKGWLAEAVVALRSKQRQSTHPTTAKTVTMDQKNFEFLPETLAIRTGDAVRFTSRDAETHNVRTSGRLASFSENMPRGGEYMHTFERAGGIRSPLKISCIYHGAMRAWIFVFDHPHYAITGADGLFKIDSVTPGEYTLEMVHSAGRLRWRQPIKLAAGKDLTIDIRVSPDYKIGAAR